MDLTLYKNDYPELNGTPFYDVVIEDFSTEFQNIINEVIRLDGSVILVYSEWGKKKSKYLA